MAEGARTFRATRKTIKLEWTRNRAHPRSQVSLVLFRLTQYFHTAAFSPARLLALPATVVYRVVVEWVFGIEIPWRTEIGPGLAIFHGTGVVLNKDAIVGRGVSLRQGVTLGHREHGGGSPTLGDNVDIGPNAVLLGPITIGENARIGAGAVVLNDVPAGTAAVGNPARIIHSD